MRRRKIEVAVVVERQAKSKRRTFLDELELQLRQSGPIPAGVFRVTIERIGDSLADLANLEKGLDMKRIVLMVNIATRDGELLDSTPVTIVLDLTEPLDGGRNASVLASAKREAGLAYADALGVAFARAKAKAASES